MLLVRASQVCALFKPCASPAQAPPNPSIYNKLYLTPAVMCYNAKQKGGSMAYTIIEVERKTGVASRTLRFWADKGLFPFVQKDIGYKNLALA